MLKPGQALTFFILLGIWGCMPDTSYQAYVDQKNKGQQAFLKDVKVCRHFVDQQLQTNEGSAGDRLSREGNLFLLCMKNHFWILKQ